LGTAVELLYDNNLGTNDDKNVFATVLSALQVEQRLEERKKTLPAWLQPRRFEGVPATAISDPVTERFRTITFLRYHYMRSLIHRPVLIQILHGTMSSDLGVDELRQQLDIGRRNIEVCVKSSMDLVFCVHAVNVAGAQKSLLGTWWCALYFCEYQITLSEARLCRRYCLMSVSFYGSAESILRLLDQP